ATSRRAPHARRQVELDRAGRFLRGDAAEDEDRRRDPGSAQLERFVETGDREVVDARGDESARHRHRAVAVRVRLDDGADAHRRAHQATDFGEVARERVEIDGADRARLHGWLWSRSRRVDAIPAPTPELRGSTSAATIWLPRL